jgi:hypothetical protein
MRSDEALDIPPAVMRDTLRRSGHHAFKDVKQLRSDVQIALVASLMESNQDLVGQSARVSRPQGRIILAFIRVHYFHRSYPFAPC